ncbi:DUF5629 family protein [Pseudomonas sp. dw_358]|uniref:DUF5629 family protein n=1 Tax=Pseudomonas sp. dw_358 TaxID=2720083 RepID=UPI001BD28022|nr:DUF5629 family protein [Pseudomonas sp. dw_358]
MSESLLDHLRSTDGLLFDNLFAEFSLGDDASLHIEVMDGRDLKRWDFTPAHLGAAHLDPVNKTWQLANDHSSHHIVCLSGLHAGNDDDDETEAP